MLKVFRDNLKNLAWILWVIIALFILALAADFGASFRRGGQQAVAATVGGETVSVAEFQREYRQIQNLYRQVYGDQLTPEVEKQMRLPLQALDRAVNQKILMAEARRLGLAVTDAELRERILKEPVFQDEQGRFIGEEKYTQILQANQMNPATFEEDIRQELLLKKLSDALSANLYVSEDEVQRAYREQVERAKIRYLQLPRARFAAEAEVQPAELATYFASHKQEFRLPEQREAAYLLVDASRMADQAKVTDGELRSWYDAHQADFTQEEQVRARHILVMVNDKHTDADARQLIETAKKRIEGGADFAVVAREVSEDPASKASGGDLGYFGRKAMVKEFEDAAFGALPGKLVGPVKSSFGYHLLEVMDKRAGGVRPFAEAKEQIRARLSFEKSRQLAESRAKDLAGRLTKDKPRGIEDLRTLASQNPGVSFAETGKFGAQDPLPGIGPGSALSTTAFSLKKGEVSQPVQVPQGWAIVYLKEIYPPRTPELAEVEPRVRTAAAGQKLQQAAMAKLEGAKRAGKSLDQIAAELGVQVKETAEFGGQGGTIPEIGYNPELVKAAMALQAGQTGGPVADAQGALLFQVTEHKGWDPKQYASNRDQTRSSLLQEKLSRLQAALIEQRRRELNVQYDRQLLEQLGIAPEQQG
ncbi:MAG TPA: SurA N-terminal domain-containing protein [Thermoanaerobaculia bacterium]|jgi:peptidyl-prolyl cis-trans isomerase D|nr:SurA N-terminal domain-containing protein [Thermoanaerobaculia bacterium]